MRMISELSLFTIVSLFLSQSTGTVKLYACAHSQYRPHTMTRLKLYQGSPAVVVGLCFEVKVFDVLSAIERIRVCAWERVRSGEWPAVLAHVRRYHADVCRPVCRFDGEQLDKVGLPMKSSRPFNFRTISVRHAHADDGPLSQPEPDATARLHSRHAYET